MAVFPKNELFQFMAWMLYTMLQLKNVSMKDMLYYEKKKEKQCIICALFVVYVYIHMFTRMYDF